MEKLDLSNNELTLRQIIDRMNLNPEERKKYMSKNYGIGLDTPLEQYDLNILGNVFDWERDKDGNVIINKYTGLPRSAKSAQGIKEQADKLVRKSQKKQIGRTEGVSIAKEDGALRGLELLAQQHPEYVQTATPKQTYYNAIQEFKNHYNKNSHYYNDLFLNSGATVLALYSLREMLKSAYYSNKADTYVKENGYIATSDPKYEEYIRISDTAMQNADKADLAGSAIDFAQMGISLSQQNYPQAAWNAAQMGVGLIGSRLNLSNPRLFWVPKGIGFVSNVLEVGNNLLESTKKGESK